MNKSDRVVTDFGWLALNSLLNRNDSDFMRSCGMSRQMFKELNALVGANGRRRYKPKFQLNRQGIALVHLAS